MTPPDRLRAALESLQWSQRGLARELEYDERTVRRWVAGTYAIPDDVLAWLETIAPLFVMTRNAIYSAHPAPKRSDRPPAA